MAGFLRLAMALLPMGWALRLVLAPLQWALRLAVGLLQRGLLQRHKKWTTLKDPQPRMLKAPKPRRLPRESTSQSADQLE